MSDAPVAAALLRVRDVAITHDGAAAATPAGVGFTVSPGEVVLLLGPSGSGKSTLALALNGLIPHDLPATVDGTIEVGGADAATTPVSELSQTVGMVFQDPDAQMVTATVLDEASFGPENLTLPVGTVLSRAESALRRVGLWDRRAESPDALSGGGRQRLAIAAALAMGSPLLVLDEPTANLDPGGTEEVYEALAEVVAGGERAVVLTEHNLDAALPLVDRVVVLDAAGGLLLDAPVDELRTRAEQLDRLGVWLPQSTLAALQLRRAGYRLDPLPLTPQELRICLEHTPAPAAAASAVENRQIGRMQYPPAPNPLHPTDLPVRTEPIVRVRGLTMSRGRGRARRIVLEDVSLEIAHGEFVAVVGENGAGKTTLAQAIAGVQRPPRDTVVLDGLDVSRTTARGLLGHVGFVFQNPEHQFITTTVFDEIAHGLRMQRLPEDVVRARADEILERFGLLAQARVHPFLLSGGQKRRLSVGTALVGGARVLVLDEPTFGQDRARAGELLGLLDDLRSTGTTIVIVTHDMQVVAEHADRAVVLSGGRLVTAAAAGEVLADEPLLRRAGLRPPPLAQALRGLTAHPELADLSRLADLPGARP